jgi:N-acetylneuraminate synthase
MEHSREVRIADRVVGSSHRPFIIAELSANHNGDLQRALNLIEVAKSAGADAIKLQTYTADTMTLDVDGPDFLIKGGLWDGYRLYDLYKQAQTPWEWHRFLFARARELGLIVFSSPFDETAVELLEGLDAPAYKIASFEVVDHALIGRAARTGKPLIMSTGMATQREIGDAVEVARSAGARDIVLLHCTSAYPAPPEDMHLRTIPHLAKTFDVVSGLSDHTMGSAVAVSSIALGAAVIEKHFILNRQDGGPDSAFSMEPAEFASMCRDVCLAWQALGHVNYVEKPSERANLAFRRSLYVVADVAKGEQLTKDNIRAIRPGFGLAPKHLDEVVGRRAARDLTRGTALKWEMVQ